MTASTPATPTSGDPAMSGELSIGQLVQQASGQLSTLVHGEIELAKVEIRSSVKNAGTGAGFFGVAAVLAIFAVGIALIAVAEGLVALGVPRWLAYLIVFVVLLVLIAIFGWLGYRKVQRVKAPERTIATSKDTVEFLKHPTQDTARAATNQPTLKA